MNNKLQLDMLNLFHKFSVGSNQFFLYERKKGLFRNTLQYYNYLVASGEVGLIVDAASSLTQRNVVVNLAFFMYYTGDKINSIKILRDYEKSAQSDGGLFLELAWLLRPFLQIDELLKIASVDWRHGRLREQDYGQMAALFALGSEWDIAQDVTEMGCNKSGLKDLYSSIGFIRFLIEGDIEFFLQCIIKDKQKKIYSSSGLIRQTLVNVSCGAGFTSINELQEYLTASEIPMQHIFLLAWAYLRSGDLLLARYLLSHAFEQGMNTYWLPYLIKVNLLVGDRKEAINLYQIGVSDEDTSAPFILGPWIFPDEVMTPSDMLESFI